MSNVITFEILTQISRLVYLQRGLARFHENWSRCSPPQTAAELARSESILFYSILFYSGPELTEKSRKTPNAGGS